MWDTQGVSDVAAGRRQGQPPCAATGTWHNMALLLFCKSLKKRKFLARTEIISALSGTQSVPLGPPQLGAIFSGLKRLRRTPFSYVRAEPSPNAALF